MNLLHHLENKLTVEEKEDFLNNGYLIVPNVISDELILRLDSECLKLVNETGNKFVNEANVISRSETFLDLALLPKIPPKITGLLGWNIWINHSHANVHPYNIENNSSEFEWHRDGGVIENDLFDEPPLVWNKGRFFSYWHRKGGHGNNHLYSRFTHRQSTCAFSFFKAT